MERFTIPVVIEAPTEADAIRVLGEAEPKNEAGDYNEHSIWNWGQA